MSDEGRVNEASEAQDDAREDESACETCRRPKVACVCDRVVQFETTKRVLVLQHPQEKDAVLGSAQILTACLPKAKVVIGLSWPNFAAAIGEEGADPKRWAVLFPDKESNKETDKGPAASDGKGGEDAKRRGEGAAGEKGPAKALDSSGLEGIVVLDGTWSKAKTLWWRNPWLLKLNRLGLKPGKPSIYGSLRAEPKREYVSTLESVAQALTLMGEPKEIEVGLERIFRTLVQRVRDAAIIPPAAPYLGRRPQRRRR